MRRGYHLVAMFSTCIFALLLELPTLSLADPATPQVNYTIGRIPYLNSWGSERIAFRINPDRMKATDVVFSLVAQPQPLGVLRIDPATGDFSYAPTVSDKQDFAVTFKASPRVGRSGQEESQTVIVSRWPDLAPEYDLVSRPRPGVPDSESLDYLTVGSDSQRTEGQFNTLTDRTTRKIQIAGKAVVFQKGHRNGLYERFHSGDADSSSGSDARNADIRGMTVIAETVVIRSPLRLPRTDITIFARELILEDQDPALPASINTSPVDYKTRADPFKVGDRGEDAGNIDLYVLRLTIRDKYPQLANVKRLVLRGGRGRDGGLGQGGTNGINMQDYYPGYSPPGSSLTAIVPRGTVALLRRDGSIMAGAQKWPDGGAATAGGAPGNGGSGGKVRLFAPKLSISDLSQRAKAAVDFEPGAVGTKPPLVKGGTPGTPAHALWIRVGVPASESVIAQHDAVAGADADAPDARPEDRGRPGSLVESEADPLAWLQPAALQAVTAYAKDAYLDSQLDAARSTLGEYSHLLNDPSKFPQQTSQELLRLRNEIDLLLQRLSSNLDYFGNPPGWVPMLSFQVNLEAYRQEISSAIRLFYLCRLINRQAGQVTKMTAALKTTVIELTAAITRDAREYNELQDRIPILQQQLAVIEEQQKQVDRLIKEREAQLRSMAVATVAERHRASFVQMALKVISTAAKIVPVFQPTLGAVGTVLSSLENAQSDPIGALEGLAGVPEAFSKANLTEGKKQLNTQIAKIDPNKSKDMKEYVKNLVDVGRQWGDAYKQIAKANAETSVPADEVDAELQRIKAQDPDFQQLVDKVSNLKGLKAVFTRDLEQVLQSINQKADQITADMRAIDAMNTQLEGLVERVNPDMLVQVREIERRARERLLRYQYYMVKAYEYELLSTYTGNLHLDRLVDRVVHLLDDGKEQSWLDDPKNFQELSTLYQDDLRQIALDIFTKKNTTSAMRTNAPMAFPLTSDEVRQLNETGWVTINLGRKGLIGSTEENARIIAIGAAKIEARTNGTPPVATLRLVFEHSGLSMFETDGRRYMFNHYRSNADRPITWGSWYDVVAKGAVTQEQYAPSEVALLRYLLGPQAPEREDILYARPGAFADIVIRKEVTPGGADVRIDSVKLAVTYEFYRSRPNQVVLDVSASDGSPKIACDTSDLDNRSDGLGTFRRTYVRGTTVTLTAQESFGSVFFKEWREGERAISQSSRLTVELQSYRNLRAVYEIKPTTTMP